jgi:kanosamine 6-kinase
VSEGNEPGAYLGIDVGGTKVALRLEATTGAGAGEAVARESVFLWSPDADAERDVAELTARVRTLIADWNGPVRGIGVAMPATVDADGRVTTWPGRPSWTGLDLAAALAGLVPAAPTVAAARTVTTVPVAYADDGDLAALAEARAAGCRDLLYLGVGTGIGGGLVLGGEMCPGPARGSCEIGHLVVALDGPVCDCGRRGCVQALASGPATLRRAAERRRDGDRDRERDGDDTGTVSYAELREGSLAGAPWAAEALETSARALAATIVGVSELVRPALAVVGGGFAGGLPGFVDAVAAATSVLGRPGHPAVPVVPARLGGLSSLRGAVELARSLV